MALTDNYDKIQFASVFSYQKIATEGSREVSMAFTVNTLVTIPHNLGYVPTARVWYEPFINSPAVASGQVWPITGFQYGDLGTISLNTIANAYLDSTNLYVQLLDTSGGTRSIPLYWRIYYDT